MTATRRAAGSSEIRARGVLRVGYLTDSLPFAFVNARGDLVGFDIEMAHILAGDLGVSLELAPVSRAELAAASRRRLLRSRDVRHPRTTVLRAAQMTFSASYLDETLAFIVPDHLRDEFASWDAIRSRGRLRIGVPPLPYYIAKIRQELPDAELVPIDSVDQLFAGGSLAFDAVVLTAERGSAWTLLHPQYSVAVPMPQPIKVPLAYPVAAHDEALAKLVSTWIELKQKDGTIDALFAHWILGRDAVGTPAALVGHSGRAALGRLTRRRRHRWRETFRASSSRTSSTRAGSSGSRTTTRTTPAG